MSMHTVSRRRTGLAIVGATALALVAGAAGAAAQAGFGDVPSGSVHAAGIDFAAASGVTAGCGDGSNFCPDDEVTRDQMATFMHRLSGTAPGVAPSVDAATVQGRTADDLRGAVGPAGPTGPQGPAGDPATSLHAVVNADGSLARGDGVESARKLGIATGQYEVVFDRDVRECTHIASIGRNTGFTPPAATVGTARRSTNPDGLFVMTHDTDGVSVDAAFHVAVFC